MIAQKVVHAIKPKVSRPEADSIGCVYTRVCVKRASNVPQAAYHKPMLAGLIGEMDKALHRLRRPATFLQSCNQSVTCQVLATESRLAQAWPDSHSLVMNGGKDSLVGSPLRARK